ncbi:MAG: hypothetical protein N2749_04365 [Clostridia bacterium]|nr:hypothetical protein [Clostridia bacterium]
MVLVNNYIFPYVVTHRGDFNSKEVFIAALLDMTSQCGLTLARVPKNTEKDYKEAINFNVKEGENVTFKEIWDKYSAAALLTTFLVNSTKSHKISSIMQEFIRYVDEGSMEPIISPFYVTWKEHGIEDERFIEAVCFAKQLLARQIHHAIAKDEAIFEVERAIDENKNCIAHIREAVPLQCFYNSENIKKDEVKFIIIQKVPKKTDWYLVIPTSKIEFLDTYLKKVERTQEECKIVYNKEKGYFITNGRNVAEKLANKLVLDFYKC